MTAMVRIYDMLATFMEGHWSVDDQILERILNAGVDRFGPSGSDPNPCYTEAQRVVKEFGGEIILYDKLPFHSEVVY